MPRDRSPDTRRTPESEDGAAPTGAHRRLDEEARRRLGRDLRRFYAGVLDKPLPERLATLADELATAFDREGSR